MAVDFFNTDNTSSMLKKRIKILLLHLLKKRNIYSYFGIISLNMVILNII